VAAEGEWPPGAGGRGGRVAAGGEWPRGAGGRHAESPPPTHMFARPTNRRVDLNPGTLSVNHWGGWPLKQWCRGRSLTVTGRGGAIPTDTGWPKLHRRSPAR